MNEELIKRINKLIKIIESGDTLLNGTTWEILQDCRVALTKKYVPLKPLEWSEQMPGLKEADLYKVIMAESVVIRRAGLEVQE